MSRIDFVDVHGDQSPRKNDAGSGDNLLKKYGPAERNPERSEVFLPIKEKTSRQWRPSCFCSPLEVLRAVIGPIAREWKTKAEGVNSGKPVDQRSGAEDDEIDAQTKTSYSCSYNQLLNKKSDTKLERMICSSSSYPPNLVRYHQRRRRSVKVGSLR